MSPRSGSSSTLDTDGDTGRHWETLVFLGLLVDDRVYSWTLTHSAAITQLTHTSKV